MTDLAFYTHFATTGQVYGLGIGSTPEQWTGELSEGFLDDRQKKRLRCDYGLIEVGFSREQQQWKCFGVSVQVHRLASGDGLIPQRLQEDHGPFRSHVPFDELSADIGARNVPLEELSGPGLSGYTAYKTTVGSTTIYISAQDDDPLHRPGDIWSITVHA
ncbi:hypothetical protein [Streptomyces avicenniae]|uniref:hypothetical protein n=1 Tax=Streptomyces avicenniae TaxID=500153 RepID=UPI000699B397|nr:hypothetical protein [Streptomyces avicenniae]